METQRTLIEYNEAIKYIDNLLSDFYFKLREIQGDTKWGSDRSIKINNKKCDEIEKRIKNWVNTRDFIIRKIEGLIINLAHTND